MITKESGELDEPEDIDLQRAKELAAIMGFELPKDYKPPKQPPIANYGEGEDPLDTAMFEKIQNEIKKNVVLIYRVDPYENEEQTS